VVYAPFSLAVARLHCPARLALAHLPPGSAAGQAGSPALQCVAPLACPALRGNCLQDRRARTSALRASVACAAYPFGSSALRLRSDWRARTSALRASVACAAYPFGSSALRLRSDWRARGSSAFGVFASLRSPIWLRLRAEASSSCMQRLFHHPARNPQGCWLCIVPFIQSFRFNRLSPFVTSCQKGRAC